MNPEQPVLPLLRSSWDGKQGPVKDVYSLANNPQYKLEVQCPTGGAAMWVLLTRHITDKVSEGLLHRRNHGEAKVSLRVTADFCCSRMILHKTESLSLWLFIRRMARRSTTQVRLGEGPRWPKLLRFTSQLEFCCLSFSGSPSLHRRYPDQQSTLPDQDQADWSRNTHLHTGGVPV